MSPTLILPCYNPPPHWEQNIIAQYPTLCNKIGEQIELIIVFDGVTNDNINDTIISDLKKSIEKLIIIDYPVNMGKGFAIRQGVSRASGSIILYTDIDFPFTLNSIYNIYKDLATNKCDVAVGIKDKSYYKKVPLIRKIISYFLRIFIRLFFAIPFSDTQCGLKGFKENVKPTFLSTHINRYLFDLEFIRNCYRLKNIQVKTIPVTLNENVHFRKMNYRILLLEIGNLLSLFVQKPQ